MGGIKGGKKKVLTLLEQKERREAEAKKEKSTLTVQQRRERNQKLAKEYQEKRLREGFGPSRDNAPKRKSWWQEAKDEWTDEKELAPLRKKVSRVDDNLGRLTKKQDP